MSHPIDVKHHQLVAGDTVVVTSDSTLPVESVEKLRAYVLEHVPPGVFALVLDGGLKASVLGDNEALARECAVADELLHLLGLEPDQCRTEGGVINLPRVRSLLADREAAPFGLEPWEETAAKNAAYSERNQLVALLARLYPSGIAQTSIEGWAPEWQSCVYIDLPTGQASWHYHASEALLFADLPPYARSWDGHTTEEKYRRIAALAADMKNIRAAAAPSKSWQRGSHLEVLLDDLRSAAFSAGTEHNDSDDAMFAATDAVRQFVAELASSRPGAPILDQFISKRELEQFEHHGRLATRIQALQQQLDELMPAVRQPSPTAGMSIAQRILHVGGRNNAAGYVEFGSTQAVEALVRQVLRDLPSAAAAPALAAEPLKTLEADARPDHRFGWGDYLAISEVPAVDEALRAMLDDQTEDNATCLIRAVVEAAGDRLARIGSTGEKD